jgi:hypothetical protein
MFGNWVRTFTMLAIAVCGVSISVGQSTSEAVIPSLVRFTGVLFDANGTPLIGTVGVTFSLYKDEKGGAPLWIETQNVRPDQSGAYAVALGSTTREGLPSTLFASGEARWLGVRVQGQEEQPRVMLLAVPYALKAGDAQTIGGLPPSAFVLATPGAISSGNNATSGAGGPSVPQPTAGVTGSGTANYLPLWTSATNIGNSIAFQSGTGSKAKLGINTIKPAATLDVKGGATIRGLLSLPAIGTATATAGDNSQPLDLASSVFNSGSNTAVPQTFQWLAEPVGNNTSTATGSLNLLFGQGVGKPVETGLSIASNGQISFAAGQTFPGTGSGTITGVTAGTDLTGGGNGGNVTLNLDTSKVPQLASSNSFTGAVGLGAPANSNGWTPLAVGGANTFGTWITLANTSAGGHTWNILSAGSGNAEGAGNLGITDFTGTSKIFLEGNVNTANLTASGVVSGNAVNAQTVNGGIVNATTSFNLGGSAFAFGSTSNENVFLGFSGNPSATGIQNTSLGMTSLVNDTTGELNTAIGSDVLIFNSTGNANTGSGVYALESNTTGSGNTVSGYGALTGNTTGNNNTAIGYYAGFPNAGVTTGSNGTFLGYLATPGGASENSLINATAIGSNAEVTESNAMVLGSIKGVNSAAANTLVGIGTTAPTQSLEVDLGNSLVRGVNNFQKNGDTAFLYMGDTNNFIQSTYGTGITIGVFQVPTAIRINQYSGFVGIGTTAPTNRLTLGQGTGAALGDGWTTYSSRRWKTHIQTLDDALAKVEQLRGVSYDLKQSGRHEIGVIAEEVGQVVPEVVTYEDNGQEARGVDYSRLTALLIEAVKQQQRQIRSQQSQIRAQQQQILRLNNKVDVLATASHAGDRTRPAFVVHAISQTVATGAVAVVQK